MRRLFVFRLMTQHIVGSGDRFRKDRIIWSALLHGRRTRIGSGLDRAKELANPPDPSDDHSLTP